MSEVLLKVTGLKIMRFLVLGNLLIEFTYSLLAYLKKEKFDPSRCLKYMFLHLSITNVINKKAKKLDLFCVVAVYAGYLCNNAFIKPNIKGFLAPFFNGHFNDSIAMIMLLAYFNISYAAKSPGKRIYELHTMLFICFLWGILWENFAPIFNPIAVKDPLDILCYCFGGIVYYTINVLASSGSFE
jgi:hypothetical protein